MNKIVELFGIYCDKSARLTDAVRAQICPYTCKKCMKVRKSIPDVAIGTCTVRYGEEEIIICPSRLTEKRQIFIDCLQLLTSHEPGNMLYIIPEVAIPGGKVDYFLVSSNKGKIKDFVGIEIQTMDTTGTVWPERQRLLHEYGIDVPEEDMRSQKGFGINWKMTAKTILLQMHHKAETFETLNKHLALIIQKPFFDYINKEFMFQGISGLRIGDAVHIHSYAFEHTASQRYLSLDGRVSTDSYGIAKSLGLSASPKITLERISKVLEKRLSEQYRFKLD